eukprot:9345878-Alexandrium_andersonii.AAC.1
MSASLVGSEMCIRDRIRESDGASAEVEWGEATFWEFLEEHAWMEGQEETCLLYTSDAADDM